MFKRLTLVNTISLVTFISFFILFIFTALRVMVNTPFHDFDEAHRAENAKQMKRYGSFFVPLTGSIFDRVEKFKIQSKKNPDLFLYYHLERPFLVYLSMIGSTLIFGEFDWAYRLPSFMSGILTILAYVIFAFRAKGSLTLPLFVGFLVILTSSDLWLSSEYAQMDTTLTLFLFLSLMMLIYFFQTHLSKHIYLSGIFFALAVLSKGQLAVVLFLPILLLLVYRKLTLADISKFLLASSAILIPWVIYLSSKFGFLNFLQIFTGFAFYFSSIIYDFQKAPFFWYVRWWWESFRPGWTLFLALVVLDTLTKRINLSKLTLLFYIFGGLLILSIPINKIWWYTLPFIPAISFYVYLSVKDYLDEYPERLANLTSVIFLSSLPIFLGSSNTLSLSYGFFTTILSVFILKTQIFSGIFVKKYRKQLFLLTVILILTLFYLRFPIIRPYHWNTKEVATYYKNQPGQKCLWYYDMPGEAVLFYSDAEELLEPALGRKPFLNCTNYLITATKGKKFLLEFSPNPVMIYQKGNIKLYKI